MAATYHEQVCLCLVLCHCPPRERVPLPIECFAIDYAQVVIKLLFLVELSDLVIEGIDVVSDASALACELCYFVPCLRILLAEFVEGLELRKSLLASKMMVGLQLTRRRCIFRHYHVRALVLMPSSGNVELFILCSVSLQLQESCVFELAPRPERRLDPTYAALHGSLWQTWPDPQPIYRDGLIIEETSIFLTPLAEMTSGADPERE